MEFIAVILTLISVILTVRSHILCWPIGIVASVAYMFVFSNAHIYFQMWLQLVFIAQSIHGWLYWKKTQFIKFNDKGFINAIIHLSSVLILTALFTRILMNKTDNPELTFDILTTLLSLLGTWYLAVRNYFAWVVWIIADICFVLMFTAEHMWWSALLYLILTVLSIKGLIQWGKNLETD